jgi:hypothetical protein
MLRETAVDKTLNRLSVHFGRRLIIRPPASAGELAALEAVVGPLPRDLTIFLSTCNGLRVRTEEPDSNVQLWSIHEIQRAIYEPRDPPLPRRWVPLRGDSSHDCDCLVLTPGVGHGTVVRWAVSQRRAVLVASSFGLYFECWVEYVVARFDAYGQPTGDNHVAFDVEFTSARDLDLVSQAQDRATLNWLRALERKIAPGSTDE